MLYPQNKKVCLNSDGELKDIAPTFLELLNVEKNKYFQGQSLIKN